MICEKLFKKLTAPVLVAVALLTYTAFFMFPASSLAAFGCNLGLKFRDNRQTVAVANEVGAISSPLRIAKNGTTYGIALVDPSDPLATSARIKTSSGIKALRRCGVTYDFLNQLGYAYGNCTGGHTTYFATITIMNPTQANATFNRTGFSPKCGEGAPTYFTVRAGETLPVSGFGNLRYNGCNVTPSQSCGTENSATYNVTMDGQVVDTVTYSWEYNF